MTASETWTGTTGAAWPAQWSTVGTATIQNNQGVLGPTGTGFNGYSSALLSGMTAETSADLIVDIVPTVAAAAVSAEVSVLATGTNTYWPVTGYTTQLTWSTAGDVTMRMYRWVSQASTALGTPATKTGVGFTNPWRLRMQAIGGVVRAKYWLASAAEPATWDVTSSDAGNTIASGKILLGATNSSNAVGLSFDNLVDSGGAPDTTPPSAPGTPTAQSGDSTAVVTFTAATDDVAVTGYRVYSSADSYTAVAATGSASPITVTGLTNGTAYSFEVAAFDAAGNLGPKTAASNTVTPTAGAATPGTLNPTDANIVYSPYNWNVTSTVATTTMPGAYLRLRVDGSATSVVANFDRTNVTGTQRLAVRVDGQPATFPTIASAVTIPLAGTGWAKHIIEIDFSWIDGTDVWTAPTGVIKFLGFTVAPTTVLTGTSRRRPINILCFGDSITAGYSAGVGQSDGRYGWAYPLGALLGAEVGVVGFTGQGWTNTGNGNVPAFTTTYNQIYSGVTRSFTSPTEPALILINMGTNDSGDVTTPATTVLNGILAATTTAKIAVIQQFNGTTHKTQLQAAIAACTAPARVTYLDTTGWLASGDTVDGTHPIGYINLSDLSPRIASAAQPLITGTVTPKRFVNVGGSFRAIA